jgi:drug/metabolite transporter (DMT)-like permease
VSLPFCLNHALTENYSNLSWDVYLRIGFVVIFATFLGYLLIPIGQKVLRPTTFSMYNYVQPVMASIVAVFAGLAAFGYTQALAGVLVFSGVYIVTQSKSKAQLDAEKAGKAPKAMPPSGE